MNQIEKQQLKSLIVATALYYNQQLPDEVVLMFLEDLDDLPFTPVASALKELRRDPKITRMPLPAAIRSRLSPTNSEEEMAVLAAADIWSKVGSCGYTNPERAKLELSDLAWSVVIRSGGWVSVCEEANQSESGIFKAQYRELAKSILTQTRSQSVAQVPQISSDRADDRSKSLLAGLKTIPKLSGDDIA